MLPVPVTVFAVTFAKFRVPALLISVVLFVSVILSTVSVPPLLTLSAVAKPFIVPDVLESRSRE